MMSASNRLKPVFLALIALVHDTLASLRLLLSGTVSARCKAIACRDLECVLQARFEGRSAV